MRHAKKGRLQDLAGTHCCDREARTTGRPVTPPGRTELRIDSGKTPPNAKRQKTNKGGGGHKETTGKRAVARKDLRGQKPPGPHRGQEDF